MYHTKNEEEEEEPYLCKMYVCTMPYLPRLYPCTLPTAPVSRGLGLRSYYESVFPPLTPTKEHQQISPFVGLNEKQRGPWTWQTHNQQWQTRNTTNREHSINHVEHV